jgi:hypothetical protein
MVPRLPFGTIEPSEYLRAHIAPATVGILEREYNFPQVCFRRHGLLNFPRADA